MKILTQLFYFSCLVLVSSVSLLSCKPDEPEADPTTEKPADPTTIADMDKFSDHLQFFGAVKKPGKSPVAPGGSSLRISIKDTLYVVNGTETPIKFLHRDTTKNVAGAYVQVISTVGAGGSATFFYDVPEIPEVAPSDTVSAIGFGFNLADFINSGGVLPAGTPSHIFDVTITPYNETGQPLDETVIPVVVNNAGGSKNLGSNSCSLVLAEGEHWFWTSSTTKSSGITTKNGGPEVITGGQYINGCCIDGIPRYTTLCAPNYKRLYFNTYYRAASESITFRADGTYTRVTVEEYANPAPDVSDFCANGEGVIEHKNFVQFTDGKWAMERNVSTPQGLRDYDKSMTTGDYLRLTPTSVTPSGGFIKTNGGFMWQDPCRPDTKFASPGVFGIVTPGSVIDGGGNQLVFKFFQRGKMVYKDEDYWFTFF
ncbi:MAG: hypothetical protein H7Z75_03075 [Ferruginibacter sp.]|nr:hypothetical protein [Cytophagales bacterium]